MSSVSSFFSKLGAKKKYRTEELLNSSSLKIIKGYIEPGSRTRYAIDSQDIVVDDDTWIFGNLKIGAKATVRAKIEGSDCGYAKSIVIRRS